MKRILIPLPDKDFDLTEVSVPWHLLREKGYEVTFATEKGSRAYCDPKLITGVLFGQLGAEKEAISFYKLLEQDEAFLHPITYMGIIPGNYDALVLPGGHAKGMKQYLESSVLQQKVLDFFEMNKIVGSICHGSIVLARTKNPETGRSIVFERNLTGLTKFLERTAYYITAWKLGKYYRTYPEYVQDEVERTLAKKEQFQTGGNQFKPFVCVDGNLITARWPKDAYLFAETIIKKLKSEI